MAVVIAAVNTKGGVGKSMIMTNAAIELFDRGFRVSFMDGEEGHPNGEVLSQFEPKLDVWWSTTLEEIDDEIEKRRSEFDVILVDTPGKSGDAVTALCLLADLVIVPLQTSKRDLRQAAPVIKRIRKVKKATGGRPLAYIVLNCTRKRDRAARIYREQLTPLGLPIAETQIRRLDDYKDHDVVMRDPDLNQEGAATDIRSFVDEVIARELSMELAANA